MKTPSGNFKYFAFRYLNLWLSQDQKVFKALHGSDRSKKLECLSKAAVFYKIARNLPTRYEKSKERYGSVLDIIDGLKRENFEGKDLHRSIKAVREEISAKYGGRDLLSATTKFLWMKLQSPIIIYDRQARIALGTKSGDIKEYYSLWRKEFDRNESQIKKACDSLPAIHEYTLKPEESTRQYIASIASQQWFRERVFDVHLWHLGFEGRKSRL